MPLPNFMACVCCKGCGITEETPKGILLNLCSKCSKPKEFGFPAMISKTFIPGYGQVENSRIAEMRRRVILPDAPTEPDKDYYVGRRGENGKIQDREPDY